MQENTIDQKSINNAISAYFMVLISSIFLFNKKNKYINNDFVKSHTKVAFLIHISFLITYIIFISFSFLKNISIFGYNLNYILASTIFTFLFIALLFGIYKASKHSSMKIGEIINLGKKYKIIDVNGDGNLDEKDKLTLILSYIPFLGYYIQGQYYKNKQVSEIIKLNLTATSIIVIMFILGYKNIALLFILFYTIFAVFSSINIVVKETIVGVNLKYILTPRKLIDEVKILFKYISNYLSKNKFKTLNEIKKEFFQKKDQKEEQELKELSKLKKSNYPNFLIYTPIINLISIFFKNSNKKIHIINGIMLSLSFILFGVLNYYGYINSSYYLILLFPIFFGLGYIDYKPNYKIPILYDIFEIINSIKNIFVKTKNKITEKQEEVHEETLKVGEIKKSKVD